MYILVLFGSLLVSMLGMGAILATRLEVGATEDSGTVEEATLYARAGLEMAMYRIDHDPSWRTPAAAGTWDVPTAVGRGTYRIAFTDPSDGDLVDSPYDPIEITATGTLENATQRLHMRLDVAKPGLDCLRSSVHAEGDVVFEGVTATTDHWITANNEVEASSGAGFASHVHAEVAAQSAVVASGGSQFHGTTTTDGDWPLAMPDPATVMDYYLANGTAIDVNDLPTWDANLLDNPGMEGPPPDPPTQHWFPVGACTLSADGVKKDEGSYSLIATGRASTSDGPAQDVTGKVVSGLVYGVSVRARTVGVNDQGRITLTVTSSIDGVLSWSTSWSAVEAGKFKTLEGLFVPTWNGVATSVTWRVETKNTTDDLGIDTAALVEQTPYGFVRTIHREVLSPNHNPFGAGTTNPEGIYIIDLQGGILSLQRTRISGTLVVLNGPVYVWAVVHWAPAVSNYPALLSNTEINFWLGNDGSTELNEAKANTNYNPLGTPYAGWSDADMLDTYPALMRGIVYSTNDVKLRYRPVLEGVVLADNDIISEATDVGGMSFFDVTYLSHYYRDAPPGFTATPVVTLSHGSIRRVVD